MARVTHGDTVLADSDDVVEVEGNLYFSVDSIRREHFESSDHSTVCPWKGTAAYFDIVIEGDRLAGAAWFYPEPHDAASHISDRVAFYQRDGITVTP